MLLSRFSWRLRKQAIDLRLNWLCLVGVEVLDFWGAKVLAAGSALVFVFGFEVLYFLDSKIGAAASAVVVGGSAAKSANLAYALLSEI